MGITINGLKVGGGSGSSGTSSGMSQSIADFRYLKLSGGTLTGTLTLVSDPSSDMQAATKKYVDSAVSSIAPSSGDGWTPVNASETVRGITYLVNSVACTSTTNAATPASVKAAYDLAAQANSKACSAYELASTAYAKALSSSGSGIDINFVDGDGTANASGSWSFAGGAANASGSSSVAIGHNADASNDSSIAIGYLAKANGRQTMSFGVCASASNLCAVALGYYANAFGYKSTALGSFAQAIGEYSTALGYVAVTQNANSIQLGNASTLSSITAKVSITVTSDERDKTDIEPINSASEFLRKVHAVTYVYNQRELYRPEESELTDEDQENLRKYGFCRYDKEAYEAGTKKGSRRRSGIIAQETQQALKEVYGDEGYANLVNDNLYDLDDVPDGIESTLAMNYEGFIPFLIKGFQEQDERIVAQDKRIAQLEETIQRLLERSDE